MTRDCFSQKGRSRKKSENELRIFLALFARHVVEQKDMRVGTRTTRADDVETDWGLKEQALQKVQPSTPSQTTAFPPHGYGYAPPFSGTCLIMRTLEKTAEIAWARQVAIQHSCARGIPQNKLLPIWQYADVRHIRPSRRLDRGGAAQSRAALRAKCSAVWFKISPFVDQRPSPLIWALLAISITILFVCPRTIFKPRVLARSVWFSLCPQCRSCQT